MDAEIYILYAKKLKVRKLFHFNDLYSSSTQQRDTDRQTVKMQLTNTTNTKLKPKPKVTKCQIIHAVHVCHCA